VFVYESVPALDSAIGIGFELEFELEFGVGFVIVMVLVLVPVLVLGVSNYQRETTIEKQWFRHQLTGKEGDEYSTDISEGVFVKQLCKLERRF